MLVGIVAALIGLLVALRLAAEVHLEYLWYDSVGQAGTWLTTSGAKVLLGE